MLLIAGVLLDKELDHFPSSFAVFLKAIKYRFEEGFGKQDKADFNIRDAHHVS